MGRKFALIIGNSQYQDSRLAQLVTPHEDVNDLAVLLRDPAIGNFDQVTTLVNETDAAIRLSIEDFFTDKKPDDLLVIYFSGHGVRDEQGLLYLAVNNTRATRLRATAIPSEFITSEMDRSRSKRQVLILDCCHSGAFAQGSKAVTGESAGTGPAFEGIGYGRVILTATDATQYAWEGDKVIGQADRSVFTHYLIEGLRTGDADTDHDGMITLDEIYDYVYEQVVTVTPKQTPGKWSYKQQGDIVIARNPHSSTQPAAPFSEIVDTARRLSVVKTARLLVRQGVNPGALYPLRAVTNTIGRNDGLEVTIRDTLISRRHARITRRDNEYFIEDLLSANGTFVNGKKLVEPQTMKDGDQIAIGDTVLIFQLGEAVLAEMAASEKTTRDELPAATALGSGVAAGQPQFPSVSSQPTVSLPPVKRIVPKWIWIGAAGGVLLLLGTLFAIAPSLTPGPTPTQPFSATAVVPETTTMLPGPPTDTRLPPTLVQPIRENTYPVEWNVILGDSFDTNKNQWDTGTVDEPGNAAGTLQILNGKYRWEIQANRNYATIVSGSRTTDADFYASVDARQLEGSATCGYGLMLRENPAGLYQFGLLDSDRQFSVYAWDNTDETSRPLIGPAESAAIHPGEVNKLSVIAEGSHYRFFINDQPVGEMTDDQWDTGRVTLFTQLCKDGGSAVIEFDNVELRAP
ncbi:MAG TPA: caspase family protein [Anaerolineae bacterium]|nr:caspase family protein [Anaerolineae bacterium]